MKMKKLPKSDVHPTSIPFSECTFNRKKILLNNIETFAFLLIYYCITCIYCIYIASLSNKRTIQSTMEYIKPSQTRISPVNCEMHDFFFVVWHCRFYMYILTHGFFFAIGMEGAKDCNNHTKSKYIYIFI